MSEKKSSFRTRNYASIVYPESAPEHWQDILAEHLVRAFISPLHDKDYNPTGEEKKAHYHVLLMFDSVKTPAQAEAIFKSIGGVGCVPVNSTRSYARYLCHLDNPDKAQYQSKDVISICGADYLGVISLSSDKYTAIAEMQDFCNRTDCNSFYLLCEYAKSKRPDWHRMLADCCSVFMREYLASRKWSIDNGLTTLVDSVTGEIIEF